MKVAAFTRKIKAFFNFSFQKLSIGTKKINKNLFRAIKIVSFGLFLGIIFFLPDNQEDFAFFNISKVFSQNRQIFLSPIEKNLTRPSGFILINQNSLQATSPLTIIFPRVLGVLVEEEEIEYSETRNSIIDYIVQEGDSLWSIAAQFNISVNTIIWANDLRGTTIRLGQNLVILPVSGVRYIIKEGDTISRIAERYNVETEQIIDFNNILDEGSIFIGQSIIVPGGEKRAIRIVNRTTNTNIENINVENIDIDNINIEELTPNQVRAKFSTNNYWGQSHAFPFGQCTWWPAQKRPIGRWGHAKSWLGNAERDGFRVCRGRNCDPVAGAVLVIQGHPVYGHVVYVEEVKGNTIIFSEMNNIGWGKINRRTVTTGHHTIIGFIYP